MSFEKAFSTSDRFRAFLALSGIQQQSPQMTSSKILVLNLIPSHFVGINSNLFLVAWNKKSCDWFLKKCICGTLYIGSPILTNFCVKTQRPRQELSPCSIYLIKLGQLQQKTIDNLKFSSCKENRIMELRTLLLCLLFF